MPRGRQASELNPRDFFLIGFREEKGEVVEGTKYHPEMEGTRGNTTKDADPKG